MLVAQLHSHARQQFGGLPRRRQHVVGAQIQRARTFRQRHRARRESRACWTVDPRPFDFRQRVAAQDIGEISRKQKHIHGACLDDPESFFLRRR